MEGLETADVRKAGEAMWFIGCASQGESSGTQSPAVPGSLRLVQNGNTLRFALEGHRPFEGRGQLNSNEIKARR